MISDGMRRGGLGKLNRRLIGGRWVELLQGIGCGYEDGIFYFWNEILFIFIFVIIF